MRIKTQITLGIGTLFALIVFLAAVSLTMINSATTAVVNITGLWISWRGSSLVNAFAIAGPTNSQLKIERRTGSCLDMALRFLQKRSGRASTARR